MPFLAHLSPGQATEPALVGGGRTMDYGTLTATADALAGELAGMGISPGKVVALKGHPDSEVVPALHGLWRAGATVFPMNPRWTPAEEASAMDRIPVDLVLLGPGMRPVPGGAKKLGLGGEFREKSEGLDGVLEEARSLAAAPPHPPVSDSLSIPPGDGLDRVAAHLLTSGTSGEPKVVSLTVANLRASAEGARERLGLGASDCWLASLSLAHVGGLALASRAAYLGSSLVVGGGFKLESMKGMIREGVITHVSLVPTMLQQLIEGWGDEPVPGSLRCILVGGAATDPPLVRAALALGFPVALTFGLTEASSQVATATPGMVERNPETVGPPLVGTEIRTSSDGEILVRGPTVAPGQASPDGWLQTGDLGFLDPEGHLTVTGRGTDRIISGGVNVDPVEVEAVLRGYPGVRDAGVVGVRDDTWGERVVAAVVPDSETGISPEALVSLSREALSPGKRPRSFRVVSSLPRNPNGKLDRDRLRDLFL